jgi:hypothetical protein
VHPPAADAADLERTTPVASQGSSSNSRLVAVGAVVLLLGVILVLLILRGSVGGDDPVADPVATENAEEDDGDVRVAAEDSDLVDEGDGATVRVPLPLEVEDGFEAVTLRVAFGRGLAALPQAGDRVALYEVAADPDDGDADEVDEDAPAPAPTGDAERILDDVEVLGVVGPRPAANDGTLTFVVSLAEADVPAVLPLARDEAIWFTLLPGGEDADAVDADGAEDVE